MEQLVTELKNILPLKATTECGDIVVIAAKQPQMLLYAMVGDIVRDQTRREEWWHVTLHLLSIPIQTVVWTLRSPQFTGQEIFTMGGEGRFIQAVQLDRAMPQPDSDPVGNIGARGRDRKPGLRIVK
jgi:hypothetical protein